MLKTFLQHIAVFLCKKRLEKTANIRKMRAFWKWPKLATKHKLHMIILFALEEQGSVSRNSRKPFNPGKPFVILRPAYPVKLVFPCVVKGIKIKINAKFRAPRRFRFEDPKRFMSPEMRQKVSGLKSNGPRVGLSGKRSNSSTVLMRCVFDRSFTSRKHTHNSPHAMQSLWSVPSTF